WSARTLTELFSGAERLVAARRHARTHGASYTEHDLELALVNHAPLHARSCATPVEEGGAHGLPLEVRPSDERRQADREERLLNQSEANRELIRNLAHEIKNPLGGIRGAAQLLQSELPRPQLAEYTQVIIDEADRLQLLMDRLLTPHRLPQPRSFSVHEA